MTIAYNADIATNRSWSFLRVIFRWRASVWRSVLFEFCLWTLLYYVVFAIYHFELADEWKREFLLLARHVDKRLDGIFSLSFILGFYVTLVVDRWKKVFDNIGFIDNACLSLNALVRDSDDETRLTRRNIARWLCLCQVMVLRDVSTSVRKRFPTLDSLVEAGLLEKEEEKPALENLDTVGAYTRYWMPFNWIYTSCARLRQRNVIKEAGLLGQLFNEIRLFRDNMQALCNHDWVPVPLAYSQVVSLAVRAYFTMCLISRQSFSAYYNRKLNASNRRLHPSLHSSPFPDNYDTGYDYYVPFMTMIQLLIYMGWLKVAEALLNPFGEDDDDFECNYIIDRNITVSMLMVDRHNDDVPRLKLPLTPAGYPGDKGPPVPLYSEEAAAMPQNPLVGSAVWASVRSSTSSKSQRKERMGAHAGRRGGGGGEDGEGGRVRMVPRPVPSIEVICGVENERGGGGGCLPLYGNGGGGSVNGKWLSGTYRRISSRMLRASPKMPKQRRSATLSPQQVENTEDGPVCYVPWSSPASKPAAAAATPSSLAVIHESQSPDAARRKE